MDQKDSSRDYNDISNHKEKIISSKPKIEKKSFLTKVIGSLISDDIPDVKTYIVNAVISHAKETFLDIMNGLVNGNMPITRSGNHSNLRIGHVSYDRQYNNRNVIKNEENVITDKAKFRYQNLWFDNAGDAQVVLHSIEETLEEYHMISVLNLYDSVDLPTDNTMAKYGWTNIDGAKIVPYNGGYLLKLPKAMPIELN